MNKDKIKEILNSNILKREDLSFIYNGNLVKDRFDNQEKPYEEDTYLSILSFNLYSLTINSIILKGLGKIRNKPLLKVIKSFFNNVVKNTNNDILNNVKIEVEKAETILESFLYDYEKITLPQLLANYLPIILINLLNNNYEDSKKILKTYDNYSHRIINQATLYIRSVYHSILSIENIDQTLLSFDKGDVLNGIIFYDDMMILTSEKDMCTFNGFKTLSNEKLDTFSKDSSLEHINKVGLLYLTKDIIVMFKLND